MAESTPARILVIDDDRELTWALRENLTRESYDVEVAHDGREGLRHAYVFQPDLILLDILMPVMDGWEMLRRFRELSDVPIVLISALANEDAKVHGLDLGADDYVTKPFGTAELKARIQAVLRRATLGPSNGAHYLRFDADRLIIDPPSHRVTVCGEVVDLTVTEYKLLLYLAYNAGRVLTTDQILDSVWGVGYEDSPTCVKVYIRRLRSKIEEDPARPRYILTRRGGGYLLAKI